MISFRENNLVFLTNQNYSFILLPSVILLRIFFMLTSPMLILFPPTVLHTHFRNARQPILEYTSIYVAAHNRVV